jgi:membrane fusion protein, copper/silver efflux system
MKSILILILLSLLIACTQQKEVAMEEHSMKPMMVANSSSLMLTDTQIRLANITTEVVKEGDIAQVLPVNARLVANENLTEIISARVAGRIERLYFREVGREVMKDEPLYEVYSENLLVLEREYLLAKAQYEKLGKASNYESILKAAEKKLLLYGLTKNQVASLSETESLHSHITFLSPASGVIKKIGVEEGQYVSEGTLLYQIENTSQLWVEAELYPTEVSYVKVGDKINVQINGLERQQREATVNFLSPELRAGSQVMVMRATISNPSLSLKPGQAAQVLLQHSARHSLVIPVDAVIRNEMGTHVYVQTEQNTFAPRMVKTGIENFQSVEIIYGLTAGDKVVATGAYLLYSELVLKKGIDPQSSMTHKH